MVSGKIVMFLTEELVGLNVWPMPGTSGHCRVGLRKARKKKLQALDGALVAWWRPWLLCRWLGL